MDSVDTIERLANPTEPPLKLHEILDYKSQLNNDPKKCEDIKKALSEMGTAFQGRSCLSLWDDETLQKIDVCFVDNFYDNDGPCPFLYFPGSLEYVNSFEKYCSDVDHVFQTNANASPPFARQYFAYAMMWRIHGHKFPMPLGTASAVAAVDSLATKVHGGLSEVSVSPIAPHRCRAWEHLPCAAT